MDNIYSITILAERKRGKHLDAESRGAIQQLHKQGYSNRAIAREVNCSPSTVGYELQRGTPGSTLAEDASLATPPSVAGRFTKPIVCVAAAPKRCQDAQYSSTG